MLDLSVLLSLGIALLTGGCAFGGARAALNGTRERVRRVEEKLDGHAEADVLVQREIIDRLSRIEGKLE